LIKDRNGGPGSIAECSATNHLATTYTPTGVTLATCFLLKHQELSVPLETYLEYKL
jgi:hypothetical protein